MDDFFGTDSNSQLTVVKYVACCSTLPSRLPKLERAVKSVLDQTDRIEQVRIHYPWRCDRLNEAYPNPPAWMQEDPRIEVVRCEDYGPATKFLPALDAFDPGSDVALVLFDDDRIIPPGWIEPMLDAFQQGSCTSAIGRHGTLRHWRPFSFSQYYQGRRNSCAPVSFMSTSWIAVYPRSALPESTAEALQHIRSFYPQSRTNDDMMLSSFCHLSRTPRNLFATDNSQQQEWDRLNPGGDDDVSLALTRHQVLKQVLLYFKLYRAGAAPLPAAELATFLGAALLIALISTIASGTL